MIITCNFPLSAICTTIQGFLRDFTGTYGVFQKFRVVLVHLPNHEGVTNKHFLISVAVHPSPSSQFVRHVLYEALPKDVDVVDVGIPNQHVDSLC